MKKLIFSVLLINVFLLNVTAQVSVFEGTTVKTPKLYGDGAIKYIVKGDNLMKLGAFEGAILAYDNAREIAPQNADILIKRAIANYRIGRETEAQIDMKEAYTINPYSAQLHGINGIEGRMDIMAFEPMELIMKPKSGFIISYLKDKYNTTIDFETSTATINTYSTEDQAAIIIHYIDIKEWTKATNLLVSINTWKPIHLNLMGVIKKHQNMEESAMHFFEDAILLDENNAFAHYAISLIKANRNETTVAMNYIDKAIALDPKMQLAYFHKAIMLKQLEQPNASVETYKALMQQDQQLTYDFYVNKAITQKIAGDITGALESIDKAIDLKDPANSNEDIYKVRGNIYLLINDYPRAIKDYNKAISLNNDYAEAYFNRAIANLLNYNYADACADFERSMELGFLKGEEKMKYFCSF